MIGIDTNVLVRYLTLDDADQVARVDRLIDEAQRRNEALYLDRIVLCEAAWVLRSVYDRSPGEVADALERVLDARQLTVEDRDSVRAALARFRAGPGDFADHLLGERNRKAGCRTTATFDRKLGRSPHFETL